MSSVVDVSKEVIVHHFPSNWEIGTPRPSLNIRDKIGLLYWPLIPNQPRIYANYDLLGIDLTATALATETRGLAEEINSPCLINKSL